MITTIEPIYNPTPIQLRYMADVHRFVVVPAGRRSRKTLIGTRKVIARACRRPNKRYFLGAPTHQQAKGIFWRGQHSGLPLILPKAMIKAKSDSDLWIKLWNDTELHVVGLDKPQRIEGQPWDGCMITEMGDVKRGAWLQNIRPLLSDTNGFAILDGVPEGQANDYYDLALRAAGGAFPKTEPMIGAFAEDPYDQEWAYYSWFSSDVLSAEEMAAAKREYDERTFRQEYEGSFEGESGRAYYAFGIHNIVDDHEVKPTTVHVGMDFNVDPMTAVLADVDGDTINQFDEVYLRHSNTYEMVRHLIENKQLDPANTVIYPDATGASESSNATLSDIRILKNAGFKVKAHAANPRQRDRLAAVNTRFKATDGTVRYYVQRRCKKTINDLNRVQVLPDGRLDKEQADSGLTHISDALGYMTVYLFPIKRDYLSAGTVSRHEESFY